MKKIVIFAAVCFSAFSLRAQKVIFSETASVEQIFGDRYEDTGLLPMNDLNMGGGYACYEAEIDVMDEGAVLEVENVRDFAAVYINGRLQGTLTNEENAIELNVSAGSHLLQLYAENIGRITYGPEILDNSKGLFGEATLDGGQIVGWTMIPLDVKGRVGELEFGNLPTAPDTSPAFYRARVDIAAAKDLYLDVSGWGMGEVWLNGVYMGSFWENEKQQSILLLADDLMEGRNGITVFELKNNGRTAMRLSPVPVFK